MCRNNTPIDSVCHNNSKRTVCNITTITCQTTDNMIRTIRSDRKWCCNSMVYRKAIQNISSARNRKSKRMSKCNINLISNGVRNINIYVYSNSMNDITSKCTSNSKFTSRVNVTITTN